MRVRETLSSLLRRWYILVVGLLLTAAMCWAVQGRIPVTYEAKGSQLLMPPSATVGAEGNPYLYLGGLSQALDVLIRHVNAAEATKPVLRAFPGTVYSVEADPSTSGPILVISASGTTADGTLGVLNAALDKVPAALKDMQDELAIADNLRINVRTVVVDGQATKNNQSQMRLMLLAAGAGTVGTVLLTAMMDNFLSGRKRPRHTDGEKRAAPVNEDAEGQGGGRPSRDVVREDGERSVPQRNRMRQRSQAGTGASSE